MALKHRFRQFRTGWKPTTSRVISAGYYLTGGTLLLFILLSSIFYVNPDLAGAIGDYLSGAGQIIILIWVIITFWLQRADMVSQQDEQARQDKSQQQRNIILIYQVHIKQIDNLLARFIERIPTEHRQNESDLKPLSELDKDLLAYSIAHNSNIIKYISDNINNENHFASIFLERYVVRFENLRDTIIDVDISNHLYDALVAETDHLDLYFVFKSLKDRSLKRHPNLN